MNISIRFPGNHVVRRKQMRALLALVVTVALHPLSGVGFYFAKGGEPAHLSSQKNLEQSLTELSRQISEGLAENQKRTIAVVEFADLEGRTTNFGRFIAEELITRLYQTKKFKVIERQLLNKVVTEQKLSLTGMIDQTSAQKLGKLLGVDAIASGTVTDLGKSLKVNARLISTLTGELFATAAVEVSKDDSVCGLIGGCGTASEETVSESASRPTLKRREGWTEESHFFSFHLQKCNISGASIICEFLITNTGKDRELGLIEATMYDNFGNRVESHRRRLANSVNGIMGGPDAMLISNVPTIARLGFDEVSKEVTKIARLDVLLAGDGGHFSITYRNIPVR